MIIKLLDIRFPVQGSDERANTAMKYDIPQPLHFNKLVNLSLIIMESIDFMLCRLDLGP